MRILALDTATAACSVALWDEGSITARRFQPMTHGHAEALVPMIEAVMAEAGAGFGLVDLLASTVGPGTFTGLRVGLATARGLALATGRRLVGVTTLEAIASATRARERTGRRILALIDARRGQLYAQAFDAELNPLDPPRAVASEAVLGDPPQGPLLLVGTGAPAVARALIALGADVVVSQAPGLPDAADVAAIAAKRPESAKPGFEVAPLYLRGPGAMRPGISLGPERQERR